MSFTPTGILLFLAIAGVCTAVARGIGGEVRGGLIVSIAIGFLGALFGPWLASQFQLGGPLDVEIDGRPFPIVWSILGAAALVVAHTLQRARGGEPQRVR